jgi:hypothetical protein
VAADQDLFVANRSFAPSNVGNGQKNGRDSTNISKWI